MTSRRTSRAGAFLLLLCATAWGRPPGERCQHGRGYRLRGPGPGQCLGRRQGQHGGADRVPAGVSRDRTERSLGHPPGRSGLRGGPAHDHRRWHGAGRLQRLLPPVRHLHREGVSAAAGRLHRPRADRPRKRGSAATSTPTSCTATSTSAASCRRRAPSCTAEGTGRPAAHLRLALRQPRHDALQYNKLLFRKAGLNPDTDYPRTWDEFWRTAQHLTDRERGIYGFRGAVDSGVWQAFSFLSCMRVPVVEQDASGPVARRLQPGRRVRSVRFLPAMMDGPWTQPQHGHTSSTASPAATPMPI